MSLKKQKKEEEKTDHAIPKTMKALVKNRAEESYDYVDVDVPEPGDGELLIKVERVSICGSDINLFKWNDVAKQIAKIPFTPGHECVGLIAAIGPNVGPEYKIDSRICVENHYYCGHCYQCTHNMPHICKDMGQFGHGKKTIHGGFSQYTIVPARYAYVLKTDLEPKAACILEPFGVAQHAVEEVEVFDDTLLITGCGPIGLYAIGIAKAYKAKKVIVSDVNEYRLDIARKMGADVVLNSTKENVLQRVMEETNNDGVGALIEASGSSEVCNTCFTFLRKGGRILMVGLPKSPLHIENPLPNVIFKSLTLKTIHGRKIFHTWEESEKLIAQGKVDVYPVISHDLPMSEFVKAHKLLIEGQGCKILVNPQL